MRTDITFTSHGLTCRGWLYRPDTGAAAKSPAILMSHGFSAVKDQGLHEFAESFRARGFVVMVFDYRFLGTSDGEPRGRIVPQEQQDDIRAGLDWLTAQPFVDAQRIGLWGTSYSGGHALFVGALDMRVKAVVAQVPAIALASSLATLSGREGFDGILAMLADDHARRNAGESGGEIAVTAPAGEMCVLPGDDAVAWFARDAAHWVNRTSLESVARMAEYQPASLIEFIAPRPLLILAAARDTLIALDDVRAAFARAGAPKSLHEYDCGHFDIYPGQSHHAEAARDAGEWFEQHLGAR